MPFNTIHQLTALYPYSSFIFGDEMQKGTNRRGSNVTEIGNLLILDIDEGMSLSEALETVSGYQNLIVTSKSHQKEKKGIINDRFRVIVPFYPVLNVPKEKYGAFYTFVAQYLGFNTFDKACKDTARFYYPNPLQKVYYGKSDEVLEFEPLYEEFTARRKIADTFKPVFNPQRVVDGRLLKNELPANQTFEASNGQIIGWGHASSKATPVRCIFPEKHYQGDAKPSAFIVRDEGKVNPRFHCSTCQSSYWMGGAG